MGYLKGREQKIATVIAPYVLLTFIKPLIRVLLLLWKPRFTEFNRLAQGTNFPHSLALVQIQLIHILNCNTHGTSWKLLKNSLKRSTSISFISLGHFLKWKDGVPQHFFSVYRSKRFVLQVFNRDMHRRFDTAVLMSKWYQRGSSGQPSLHTGMFNIRLQTWDRNMLYWLILFTGFIGILIGYIHWIGYSSNTHCFLWKVPMDYSEILSPKGYFKPRTTRVVCQKGRETSLLSWHHHRWYALFFHLPLLIGNSCLFLVLLIW